MVSERKNNYFKKRRPQKISGYGPAKLLTEFRKNHNTQHSLLKMLDNFKEALDQGNSISAIFVITQFVLSLKHLIS